MKYTKEIVDKIMANIRIGLNQDDAAAEAGINPDTFYDWKKNKTEFSDKLRAAHLQRKKRNLAIITKAAINHWQAAAWDLERRYREEFASWYKLEHSGPNGSPIAHTTTTKIDFSKIDDETLKALAKLGKP